MYKIIKFGIIGGIGFLTDAFILTLLYKSFGVDVALSRMVSFSLATLVTWSLNRKFTFLESKMLTLSKRKEYIKYFIIQLGGAILNFIVFMILIKNITSLQAIPAIPLAFGAVFGFLFNYIGLRYWLYVGEYKANNLQKDEQIMPCATREKVKKGYNKIVSEIIKDEKNESIRRISNNNSVL